MKFSLSCFSECYSRIRLERDGKVKIARLFVNGRRYPKNLTSLANGLLVLSYFFSLVLSRAHWKIAFQTLIPCGGNQHQHSASKARLKAKHPGHDQIPAGTCTLRGIRSRLALKVEGLARVSKNAGGRPRLASVAFDGRYMGLAL